MEVLAKSINDENIERLVRIFYPMVIVDETIGPFFVDILGEDITSDTWEEHLILLTEFWKFVILDDERYTGNPLAPHFDISGLSREAFKRWLELFYEAVDKVYEERAGMEFKQRSSGIAENFMRKLAL